MKFIALLFIPVVLLGQNFGSVNTSGTRLTNSFLPLQEYTDSDDSLHYVLDQTLVLSALEDAKTVAVAPTHWEASDWRTFGVVAATTGSCFLIDRSVRNFSQEHGSPFLRDAAAVAKVFGEPLFWIPSLGGMYLIGYSSDDLRLRRASILTAESIGFAGLVTTILKSAFHRHRPFENNGEWTWDGPSFSTEHLSFPSGHTTIAFAAATSLAKEYADVPIIPPVAYSIATLTGISRIHDDQHWVSDVVFGAAIGYFTASMIHNLRAGKHNFEISMIPSVSGYAFTVSFHF